MHAKNFLVDEGRNGQTVEAVSEDFPQLDAVAPLALIVEAVDAVDRGAFVVASQQEEVLWVLNLVSKEEADCLERLLSTVDVVSKEEIVGVGREATVLEQP